MNMLRTKAQTHGEGGSLDQSLKGYFQSESNRPHDMSVSEFFGQKEEKRIMTKIKNKILVKNKLSGLKNILSVLMKGERSKFEDYDSSSYFVNSSPSYSDRLSSSHSSNRSVGQGIANTGVPDFDGLMTSKSPGSSPGFIETIFNKKPVRDQTIINLNQRFGTVDTGELLEEINDLLEDLRNSKR